MACARVPFGGRAIVFGALGGLLGGAVGAVAFELIKSNLAQVGPMSLNRLIGFDVIGTCIGFTVPLSITQAPKIGLKKNDAPIIEMPATKPPLKAPEPEADPRPPVVEPVKPGRSKEPSTRFAPGNRVQDGPNMRDEIINSSQKSQVEKLTSIHRLVLDDILAGFEDEYLLRKHRLTPNQLLAIKKSLVSNNWLAKDKAGGI